MAPPATTPRLRDLDPHKVAIDVARRALEHITSLQMHLVGIDHLSAQPDPEHTEIYRTVHTLTGYARGDHGLDAPVQEYLISLVPLYQAVYGDVPEVDGLSDEADPTSELGIVICAARAREKITQALGRGKLAQVAASEPLSVVEAAVLLGVSLRHAHKLVAQGMSLLPRDVARRCEASDG